MDYYKNLDSRSKTEIKLGLLFILFVIFIIYLLPSGFLNKYKITLKEDDTSNPTDVQFNPYNSGLTAVVKSIGDESGDRPAWQNIVLNNNPLISATDTSLFTSDEKEADPKTANVSDLVARDIYVADQALTSSSSTNDKNIIGSSLSNSVSNFIKARVYTVSDIKISTDNSLSSFKKYGAAVSLATSRLENITPLTQFEALQKYTNTGDASVLSSLDKPAADLEATINDLLATPVPSEVAKEHLSLINLYSTKLTSFNNIKLSGEDPARGLVAMSSVEEEINAEADVLSNYISKLRSKGLEIGAVIK